jgi:hypothetical protein
MEYLGRIGTFGIQISSSSQCYFFIDLTKDRSTGIYCIGVKREIFSWLLRFQFDSYYFTIAENLSLI